MTSDRQRGAGDARLEIEAGAAAGAGTDRESRTLNRRRVLQGALAATTLAAAPLLARAAASAAATPPPAPPVRVPPRVYSARARRIVERSLVIDMLAPLKLDIAPNAYAKRPSAADIADFRASGITAIHHSFGLGGPDAYDEAIRFLAGWGAYAGRESDLFTLVGRVADIERAKAERKVAVIMGIQNAEHFRTAKDVQVFYDLGLRCAQLTYNTQNLIGSGCTERVDGGLSDYGVEVIAAMNAAGMLVDVSHCGDRTTLDAIEASPKPIAITHANCRALNDHPRLKTDEAIRKLAAKGGVLGVTGVRMFVTAAEPTTVENVVDHIDHVVKLVGIEHVGVGSDADLNGYDDMDPEQIKLLSSSYKASYKFRAKSDTDGFDHPRKMYDLTEALIRRGYSDDNIAAILGGNFRRLLAATWA